MKNGIVLREYQKEAIRKIQWGLTLDGHSLAVLPTGSGKSVIIAHLANILNEDLLIIQPSKELLEQNLEKLLKYVDREDIGIYSASMGEKTINKFTFATIGSIYKKPEDFKHFKTVIIDEAHAVNPKNLQGMFTKFLKNIGDPKIVGLTATPYRMGLAYIQDKGNSKWFTAVTSIKLINRMKEFFWNRIVFNINTQDLLDQGYLCPLEYIDMSIIDHDEIPVNKSLSDFDLEKYEEKISDRTYKIMEAISYGQSVAKFVLIFCSSVRQAEKLQTLTKNSAVVTAKTNKDEREETVKKFREGKIQTVFNVGVFTLGFDHPQLDCIILLRPTRSIALYYQILGRGVRIADGKKNCKVIDLTSTVRNLGRIETIKLEKQDGKWEILSESGSWHNKQLYEFRIEKKQKKPEQLSL